MHPSLRCLCLVIAALAAPARAAALPAPAHLADYRHDAWSAKDGLPADIDSLAQTADGWLWLGSGTGLYRHDGVRFIKFMPADGEMLLARGVSSLAAQPNGDLWIGYAYGSGVSRLRGGHLQHFSYYTQPEGATGAAAAIAIDSDASVWLASADGLRHLKDGIWHRVGAAAGFPGLAARSVYRDRHDRIWAASEERLYVLDRARQRFDAVGRAGATGGLAEAPDGRLWQAVGDNWRRLPAPEGAGSAAPAPPRNLLSTPGGLFDRDGNLWSKAGAEGMRWTSAANLDNLDNLTGMLTGVTRAAPVSDWLDQPGQLGSLDVRTFLEDREGNIWVSTRDSLERFRRNKLHSVPFPSGAAGITLGRDAAGRLLAVSAKDQRLWQLGATGAAAAPGTRLAPAGTGWYLAATAADGALLLAGADGIERRSAAGSVLIPLPPAAPEARANGALLTNIVDDGGSLWVSLKNRTVQRYSDGNWLSGSSFGLPAAVTYMAAGRTGNAWFGYKDNRLVEVSGDTLRSFGAAQGLNLGTITFIDATREPLAVGGNGMAVLHQGRFQALASEDNELLSTISGMLVTPDGDRWFNARRGVLHVTAAAWRSALDHPGQPLDYQLLDARHGYPGANQTATRAPTAVAGNGGQLWFIASTGLVMLDPAALPRNSVAPPVHILCLNTDRQRFGPEQAIRVAPDTHDLNIVYTAPSFTTPEQIRFRYRLEGVDQDWQDAGNRRVAYYTNLHPGRYRFQVIAANEDGVWNTAGASLAFELAPNFVQTRWFLALCVALCAGLAYLLVALRVRHATGRLREGLRVRQLERERLARTSHDTLLQNMQGWVMCVQAVSNRLRAHDAEHSSMELLLRQADEALALGRDQAMEMRIAGELETGLPSALEATVAVLGTPFGAACSVTSKGRPRELDATVGEETFNLGRAALVSAYRLAATRIDVQLHYGERQFELRVRHDGNGPAGAQERQELDRDGPFGLRALQRRAVAMGGQLSVTARPGGGADTVLSVPARRAYVRAPRRGPAQWWAALKRRCQPAA